MKDHIIFNRKEMLFHQYSWMERQIEAVKEDSFVNFNLARDKFNEGIISHYSPDSIHYFRNRFLSDTGKSRLYMALRAKKKRHNDKFHSKVRIEFVVDQETYQKLTDLTKEGAGTNKQTLIRLINKAHSELEQLEHEQDT